MMSTSFNHRPDGTAFLCPMSGETPSEVFTRNDRPGFYNACVYCEPGALVRRFKYDDGGRAAAGFKGTTGDCVCRAIAIATGMPYREVYDALNRAAKAERITKRSRSQKRSSARTGVAKATSRKFLEELGWTWVPTMGIGTGCIVHLRAEELPSGRLIVALSGHYVAVVNGVIHDLYDCSRDGTRCVYGYYTAPSAEARAGQ